ncbi:uncharacterized protein LOC115066677 [Bactrocera dorsalis]|uniref:Uncharacterized protein LOC115066677 n=1 Tax=Bactrocera dorsalis TaxID=27457 RepID=A0A8N4L604_BACDO|nr:uncharacterized protein LOC115066677 [Bactrocera dorsalis]
MEDKSSELSNMDLSLNNSVNIKMNNESSELTIMDLSLNGKANIKMEDESSEVALDLRKPNVKRRREFEKQFNREEKKLKLDEIILPDQEETPRNEVDTATVQNLLYLNMLQTIMQTIRMMREPVNTEFQSVLSHPMSNDNVEGDYRIIPCTSIKAEPINLTKTSTTGNSFVETLSSSSMQSGPVINQAPHVSEGIIIKQEPTDQENISPNVSNTDYQSLSPENEESPDVEIGPYGTRVSKKDLAKINGMDVSIATRTLLTLIFDRQTLATHTLSGKPSNRFLKSNRPLKPQLDQFKVADITYYVKRVFNCAEPDIRHTITMKCAEIDRIVKKRRLSKTNLD